MKKTDGGRSALDLLETSEDGNGNGNGYGHDDNDDDDDYLATAVNSVFGGRVPAGPTQERLKKQKQHAKNNKKQRNLLAKAKQKVAQRRRPTSP